MPHINQQSGQTSRLGQMIDRDGHTALLLRVCYAVDHPAGTAAQQLFQLYCATGSICSHPFFRSVACSGPVYLSVNNLVGQWGVCAEGGGQQAARTALIMAEMLPPWIMACRTDTVPTWCMPPMSALVCVLHCSCQVANSRPSCCYNTAALFAISTCICSTLPDDCCCILHAQLLL